MGSAQRYCTDQVYVHHWYSFGWMLFRKWPLVVGFCGQPHCCSLTTGFHVTSLYMVSAELLPDRLRLCLASLHRFGFATAAGCERDENQTVSCYTVIQCRDIHLAYANDTRTRNRYRKPVPENPYQFSAGVSCESVSIFSGTKIWYGVGQCSTPCSKPVITWQKWRVLIGQTIASCVVYCCVVCCFYLLLL